MTTQQNEALVRTFFDAIKKRDIDRAADCVDDGAEWVIVATGGVFRGPKSVRQALQDWFPTFPDYNVELTGLIVTEDAACAEYVARGTNTGTLTTSLGQLRPTGRRMELRACDVYRIKNGKFTSAHTYYDEQSLIQQLNPKPGTTMMGR